MDPALGVMSPFHNEARGVDGMLANAVEEITSGGGGGAAFQATLQTRPSAAPPVAAAAAAAASSPSDSSPAGTLCSFCAQTSTTRKVPQDGLYICASCAAEHGGAPRVFPLGTFKCCPTSTEGADGDVVRCAGCFRWYHAHCVGIADDALRRYVTLSTTSWYCPEPVCCEKVLHRHLKR